jgi:hypothetical protein
MQARQLVGGIAQLGERLHGMQEVSGSIPLTSTNNFWYEKHVFDVLECEASEVERRPNKLETVQGFDPIV